MKPVRRTAIYTRKSIERGLDQEFNSLDAQREAGESFVKSQASKGWRVVEDRYDDGGFSGGNVDRPALLQLRRDIHAGQVDIVVVHRLDRLSRRQLDLLRLLEEFEKHGVQFVSVTEDLNTTTPMGRFGVSMMSAFAQLEREMISARTKDKMGATRRRGAWTGGVPMLGYDVVGKKLVVNEAEAEQVRTLFDLFVTLGSTGEVVTEINERGWRTKTCGRRGGRPFTKPAVRRILTSRLYLGQVEFEGEIHEGAHDAIVDPSTWDAVQALQKRGPNRRGGRQRWLSVLGGLLRCGVCGSAFVHTYTSKGGTRYRYYVCDSVHKRGARSCPGSRLPAREIEDAVVQEIRAIGRDPTVIHQTLAAARTAADREVPRLEAKLGGLKKDHSRLSAERTRLVDAIAGGATSDALVERLQTTEHELAVVRDQIASVTAEVSTLQSRVIDEADLRRALGQFDPIWEALTTGEKSRLLSLLVERVTYDVRSEELAIELRPEGVRYLGGRERRTA